MAKLKYLQIKTANANQGVNIIPSYVNTIHALGIYSMAEHCVRIGNKNGAVVDIVIPKEGYLEYLDESAKITSLSFVTKDNSNNFIPERFDGLVTLMYK